jgi:hypothetical protein
MGSNGPFPYHADVLLVQLFPAASVAGEPVTPRRILAPNKKASRGGFLVLRKIW